MKRFLLLALISGFAASAQLKAVAYTDGSQKLNGFAIAPAKASASKPGVLILPAWMGITQHEKDVAAELSKMGYYAFIADIFGEGNYPKNTAEAGKISGYYKENYKEYQKRISLALEQLIKSGANRDNIVSIGYCFGGGGALEMARAGMPVKGVVSFHGSLGKDKSRANESIPAKVLVLHGADDPFAPKDQVDALHQELKESKADYEIVLYANAVHSFTHKDAGNDNSKGAAYNAQADRRSWQRLEDFLSEVLKK